MLPVEPKLGKMLILGSIFNCLDPIMTIVAGLSLRDPFLMPFDKKDVSHLTFSDIKTHYSGSNAFTFFEIALCVSMIMLFEVP